ncbi:MAG: HAMP domain-containing histidine kinase [Alphaproteobacteria bacterium]|nr:HAMP domain-containing histidine kinase [Alphaproteobacteria bacterium]
MTSTRSRNKDAGKQSGLLRSYAETAGAATSRRRSEMLLQAARVDAELSDRAKGEFVAHMSHDLRTPLNAIIGFSEILARGRVIADDPQKARDYAADIQHAGQHLLGIINTILDLARLEGGQSGLQVEDCDLRDVIHTTQLVALPQAQAKGQRLSAVFREALPLVRADVLKTKQVLINLVSNAIKFTPRDGDIRILVETPPGEGVCISVVDTGPGMSPDELSIALSRFGRVRNPLTQQEEGTGLGLTIVRQLCNLQGLRFRVRSKPGEGTCATVQFPRNLVVGYGVPEDQIAS